jgi:hypothetical protein
MRPSSLRLIKVFHTTKVLRFCVSKQTGLSHVSEHKRDPLTELVMQLKIEERHFYEDPAEFEILSVS